jgi:hypothetical protein
MIKDNEIFIRRILCRVYEIKKIDQIIDYGDRYEILKTVILKSSIIKGDIDAFEGMFKDRIIRKSNKRVT